MKTEYPIILISEQTGFTVYIPDFGINTQGKDLNEAIEMARDAIGLMGIDMQDDGKEIPSPSNVTDIKARSNERIMLVDVDFSEYLKKK